jgi:hypothetical protein
VVGEAEAIKGAGFGIVEMEMRCYEKLIIMIFLMFVLVWGVFVRNENEKRNGCGSSYREEEEDGGFLFVGGTPCLRGLLVIGSEQGKMKCL